MNIAVIALGTQGDVQPYLALGGALVRAGHRVRLVAPEGTDAGAAPGLEVWPVPGDARGVMASPEMRERLARGRFLEIQRYANRQMRRVAPAWARAALTACEGADLLVAGLGGLSLAQPLAERLARPLIEAHVVPLTPTREFPGPLLPAGAARLGGTFNRLSYGLIRQAMWQGFRAADTDLRRGVLGLPPAPLLGPRPPRGPVTPPVLYGVSPAVLPRPADWPARVHLTGFWFLEAAPDWQPPAALEAFLRAGPPPVSVGFGSMGSRDPQETADLVLEALRRTGQRAVLLSGWGGLLRGAVPDTVFLSDALPHGWLFPRVAAVVHHGGAGTTAAGLRAGVPGVVVPFFGDQPFWGGRVQALGVGPAPLPRRGLTADRLAQALHTVITDAPMRRRAARLGEVIREERGLGNAVRVIGAFGRQVGLPTP
ncbi:glycosyltransferase [Deinococcus aestuarii]|uniref:glycosyltransferase n=1 Tax=Deinococcus aestuarii TaxID=2774531 RepID=UPI001C0BA4C8|nr:glycosyltransferase [Deinococcus aestuarii]